MRIVVTRDTDIRSLQVPISEQSTSYHLPLFGLPKHNKEKKMFHELMKFNVSYLLICLPVLASLTHNKGSDLHSPLGIGCREAGADLLLWGEDEALDDAPDCDLLKFQLDAPPPRPVWLLWLCDMLVAIPGPETECGARGWAGLGLLKLRDWAEIWTAEVASIITSGI